VRQVEEKITKRKRGRPTEAKSIDKDQLLSTALIAFSEGGFDGTSVKTIAERLGIDGSLIYYHYKTKINLWYAAVTHITEIYNAKAKDTIKLGKDLSTIDLGKALTRQMIYFIAEHVELYKILMHEMTQQSERSDWIIDTLMKPHSDSTIAVLKAYEKDGYIVDMPICNYTSLKFSIITQFFLMDNVSKRLYGIDVYDKVEIERHADIAIQIIYNTLFKKKK